MKRSKISFVTLLLILFTACAVYAVDLGTLSYWYSDDSKIGRWDYTPYLCSWVGDGSISSSKFASYVSHAMGQWDNAGVPSEGTDDESESDLTVEAGTWDYVKALVPELSVGATGATKHSRVIEGTWIYNGTSKTGYNQRSGTKVYVITIDGRTDDQYKKTTTHEFGHAMGWYGHSSVTGDIMRQGTSSQTTLSTRDKNHLNQIY